jgi:divalent metal cation (Fe/Co/Zn/Cd) transporter
MKQGVSPSEYLRRLIYDDIRRSENYSYKDVNVDVNEKESKDEALDIDEKVDRLLKRLNKH